MPTPRRHHDPAGDLLLALGLLVRRVRAAAPSDAHELSWTQLSVLRRLDTEGAATTADLARAEGMKPQSMGTTVAALEAAGLLERTPHPTDGRQMNIAITAKGVAMRRNARSAKHTWLEQAIARLDAADREKLPALTSLISHLAEM
jgi:DNA-binding MarR family transcriptional regulator